MKREAAVEWRVELLRSLEGEGLDVELPVSGFLLTICAGIENQWRRTSEQHLNPRPAIDLETEAGLQVLETSASGKRQPNDHLTQKRPQIDFCRSLHAPHTSSSHFPARLSSIFVPDSLPIACLSPALPDVPASPFDQHQRLFNQRLIKYDGRKSGASTVVCCRETPFRYTERMFCRLCMFNMSSHFFSSR